MVVVEVGAPVPLGVEASGFAVLPTSVALPRELEVSVATLQPASTSVRTTSATRTWAGGGAAPGR